MPVDPWDSERRPPCWPFGEQCPNLCARQHLERVVYNHVELTGPWAGWRLAGRDLVSPGKPSKALRITPGRLLGLLWREAAEAKLAAEKAANSGHRGKVVSLLRPPRRQSDPN
ncbi:hypothetical protein [Pseudoxanthomonas sp.]|uniref:hypothetical protein n=1 Tax=Pseudoxanthomonas sp. TaxID=1871049 RepID=UPI0025854BAC|nr:hypothetical protein [Pseudoxanthomonas sp.]MCR6687081.1 hypothetical protein [Pseudoxanthomonas sp.]